MPITAVIGNPSAQSRTLRVATEVAELVATAVGEPVGEAIDLADHASELFDWASPTVAELVERVRASRYAVIATPTYKASYTGLLKAFLDRFDARERTGSVAIPIMTVGSPAHAMALDVHLRPVLIELGWSLPTRGITLSMDRFDARADVLAEWAQTQLPLLAPHAG